jgi:hypothetical protein
VSRKRPRAARIDCSVAGGLSSVKAFWSFRFLSESELDGKLCCWCWFAAGSWVLPAMSCTKTETKVDIERK